MFLSTSMIHAERILLTCLTLFAFSNAWAVSYFTISPRLDKNKKIVYILNESEKQTYSQERFDKILTNVAGVDPNQFIVVRIYQKENMTLLPDLLALLEKHKFRNLRIELWCEKHWLQLRGKLVKSDLEEITKPVEIEAIEVEKIKKDERKLPRDDPEASLPK